MAKNPHKSGIKKGLGRAEGEESEKSPQALNFCSNGIISGFTAIPE